MVRIKWLQHPTDPSLNETEQTLNSHSAAETFFAAKQAVISPYRGYVDFLSSTAREGSHSSNSNPPQVQGVEWSCSALRDGRPVIWRKSGFETARIETEQTAIQYGAPESVLKEFLRLQAVLTGAESARAAIERAKREQYAREEQEKVGRAGVMWSRS
jgi:hypothetical protein